jgi:hypothetical protein
MAGIPAQSARVPFVRAIDRRLLHAAAASRTCAAPSILRLHQLLVACVVIGGDRSAGPPEPPLAGLGMADAFVLRGEKSRCEYGMRLQSQLTRDEAEPWTTYFKPIFIIFIC